MRVLQTFSNAHIAFQLSICLQTMLPLTLCHAEPGEALLWESLLFSSNMQVYLFHFFLLKEKSGAKKFKANPIAPRVLPCPRTASLRFFLHHSLTYNHSAQVLTNTTFSNAHSAGVLKCNKR
jgi:hypothetical protein